MGIVTNIKFVHLGRVYTRISIFIPVVRDALGASGVSWCKSCHSAPHGFSHPDMASVPVSFIRSLLSISGATATLRPKRRGDSSSVF